VKTRRTWALNTETPASHPPAGRSQRPTHWRPRRRPRRCRRWWCCLTPLRHCGRDRCLPSRCLGFLRVIDPHQADPAARPASRRRTGRGRTSASVTSSPRRKGADFAYGGHGPVSEISPCAPSSYSAEKRRYALITCSIEADGRPSESTNQATGGTGSAICPDCPP